MLIPEDLPPSVVVSRYYLYFIHRRRNSGYAGGDLIFSDRSRMFVRKRFGTGMVLLAARTGAHGIA